MSPRVKKIFWASGCCLGAGAIILLVAWAYFSRPAVQRQYVLAALAERGVSAELERVEIGLGGAVRLENLDLPLEQGRVRIARGAGEISWSGLLGRRIELTNLEVDGLQVDLTERTKESASATDEEEVSTAEEKSPWRIVARNVTVRGEVRWTAEYAAELLVRARRLDSAAGGEGFFQLKEKSATGRSAEGELSFGWRAGENGRRPETWSDWLAANAVVALDGKVLGREGKIARVRVESFPGANGQQWKFSAGENNRTPWLEGDGSVRGFGAVDGRVRLALASAEWAAFGAVEKWPEVTANGEITVRGSGEKRFAVTADLRGTVAELARLGGKWPQLPVQHFQMNGAVAKQGNRVRVESLTARLAEENGATVEARLARPLTVTQTIAGWLPELGDGELLVLQAKAFPLPLVNALLPETVEWTVQAGRAEADLALTTEENYQLRLQAREPVRVAGLTVARAGEAQLEDLSGELPVSFSWTASGWELAAQDFVWRSGVEAMLRGAARVRQAPGEAVRWDAAVAAQVDGLARQPAWREILAKWQGRDWQVGFSGAGDWQVDAGLTVRRAEVRGAEGAAEPVLVAELLQPWKEKGTLSEGEWARVRAEEFPLALATPFLGGARLAGVADGAVVLSRKENRWRAATDGGGKLALRDVSYAAADGRSLLEHLFLESRARVEWGDARAGWAVDFAEGKVDAGQGHPLEGALALEWRGRLQTARGSLRGDPVLLLRQPLLGGFQRLQSAELSLDGEYRDGELARGNLLLANIRGWDEEPPVDAVRVAVNGLCEDGSGALQVELTTEDVVGGSGLRLRAELVDNVVQRAAISGEKIYLATLERLAHLFTPQASAAGAGKKEEEVSGVAGAEEKPFWAVWPRELTLAVGRVVAEEISVEQLRGLLTADGEKLELRELAAGLADGRVRGSGRIDFAKEKKAPRYVLAGELTAGNLPFASAVSLVNPVSSGVIDGVFDTRVTLAAEGPTEAELWRHLRVWLDFSSRKGKVRIFELDNDLVRTAGDLTDLAGGVADIVGGLTSNRRAEKISAPVRAFSRLQKYLTDFPYEEMRLRVERLADGSLRIESAEVKNDQLLIRGAGTVAAAPGVALADCPLELTARLDGKGDLAVLLNELRLVQGEADAEGYQPGPTFTLRGSVNALQNNLLATLLESARELAAQSGLKMRLPGGGGDATAPVKEAVKTGEEVLRGLGF